MKCCFRDIISSLSSLFAKVPTTSIQNEKFRVISVLHEQPDSSKTPDQEVHCHGAYSFSHYDFLLKIWQGETWFSHFYSGHQRACTLANSKDQDEMPQIHHLFRVCFAY